MADPEVAFAGPARQAELVRTGDVSPRELVTLYLERIAQLDSKLNAFRVVRAEPALAEAEEAERRREAGDEAPLLGVPIAVKDTQDVAGEVTTIGTGAADEPAREDSEVVRRLRAAGAIVIGKTNLPELAFAMFTESPTWGVTRNPWDVARVPGGSSGGSGAAVAAGLASAATASDGAGSIRIPAAYCSLFGLKPQRGRIPLDPIAEHWYGMSVNGYLTRGVLDTAVMLDATAGGGLSPRKPPPPRRAFADAARERPGAPPPPPGGLPPTPPAGGPAGGAPPCRRRSRGPWLRRCSTIAAARRWRTPPSYWPLSVTRSLAATPTTAGSETRSRCSTCGASPMTPGRCPTRSGWASTSVSSRDSGRSIPMSPSAGRGRSRASTRRGSTPSSITATCC